MTGKNDECFYYTLLKVMPNGLLRRHSGDFNLDELRNFIEDEGDFVIVEERSFRTRYGWQSEEKEIEFYKDGIEVYPTERKMA